MVSVKTVAKKGRKSSSEGFMGGVGLIEQDDTGMSVLIYGRSGSGKTRLAGTFVKPALVIRAEDGTRSLAAQKPVPGLYRTPVMTDADQLGEVCEEIENGNPKKYKSVILDTGSAYSELMLKKIIGGDLPQQMSFGDVSREAYQERSFELKERLNRFYNLTLLGVHVAVLCQERGEDGDGNEGSKILAPTVATNLSESVSKWINAKADYIGRMFIMKVTRKIGKGIKAKRIQENKHCLLVGPDENYVTKFRVSPGQELPPYLIDPSFDQMKKLAYGD